MLPTMQFMMPIRLTSNVSQSKKLRTKKVNPQNIQVAADHCSSLQQLTPGRTISPKMPTRLLSSVHKAGSRRQNSPSAQAVSNTTTSTISSSICLRRRPLLPAGSILHALSLASSPLSPVDSHTSDTRPLARARTPHGQSRPATARPSPFSRQS